MSDAARLPRRHGAGPSRRPGDAAVDAELGRPCGQCGRAGPVRRLPADPGPGPRRRTRPGCPLGGGAVAPVRALRDCPSARVRMVVTAGQAHFVTARLPGETGVPIWLLGRVAGGPGPGRDRRVARACLGRPLPRSRRAGAPPTSAGTCRRCRRTSSSRSPPAAASSLRSSRQVRRHRHGRGHDRQFDGSQGAIVVDPGPMEQLSDLAAQIVITHEACTWLWMPPLAGPDVAAGGYLRTTSPSLPSGAREGGRLRPARPGGALGAAAAPPGSPAVRG